MNAFIQFQIFRAAIVASLFFISSIASGQTPPVKATLAQDLGKTFGFCYGQRLSLIQLRDMYPDLEAAILLAQMQWDNAFKEAEEGVEGRLKAFSPDQWDDTRAKMIAQMEPILTKQNANATRENAIQFLEVVQQRAKGVLDSPTREILLSSHPKFVNSPELEVVRGYTGVFSTKGHPKAKGVELTIRPPLSWRQYEADRPNIVQKWISDAGHGKDTFMVQIRKLPALPTPEEKAEIFTESFAKEMFDQSGKTLSYTTSRLEKTPVGIVHFTQTTERLDLKLDTRGVFYYLVHEDAFIAFQFMCYTGGDAETNEARFNKLEPLIKGIVNSLVLPNNYN